jgi:hypothetical protein
MKPILSFLAFVFFLFSIALQGQTNFNPTGNSIKFSKEIHFTRNEEALNKQQISASIEFLSAVSEGNILNLFSKDLRVELSDRKWIAVLNEKESDDKSMKASDSILLIKNTRQERINLFGKPITGLTERKLVFDESALFSDTFLVYSF